MLAEHSPSGPLLVPATEPGSPAAQAVAAYLVHLAPNSRRVVLTCLRRAARQLAYGTEPIAWHALRPEQLARLRDQLVATGVAPATVNTLVVVLHGIAAAACEVGILSETAADQVRRVQGVPVRPPQTLRGRLATLGDVAALFASCGQDHSVAGVRDLAILHGLYWAGLSNAELAGLRMEDYTPTPPALRVEAARAARRRLVPLAGDTAGAFARWRACRGPHPGGLFLRVDHAGQPLGHRTTATTISHVVPRRAQQAGLRPLTGQDLRRTAIHALFETGAGSAVVQQRFGFLSRMTLARYDHRDPLDPRWWPSSADYLSI